MNTDDRGKGIPNSSLKIDSVCPRCESMEFELKNYSLARHEGEVRCARCGEFIRVFDAE